MRSPRIESRAQLIYLLSEAAELEHLLACSYLFAAYSLKTGLDEGLSETELQAVRGWRRSIRTVALQEMLHLGLVSNMLTAIGGAPNFRRPNFPQMARYYPPDIQLDLAPFNEQTIQHFVYLERPEGAAVDDGDAYTEASLAASALEVQAVSSTEGDELGVVGQPQHYRSVGQLYLAIEYGFREMVALLGEEGLFIGPVRAQATQRQAHLRGLIPVQDLASAVAAIELIIEQGEGLRADNEGTHYWRFLQIEREYRRLKRIRPEFEPARPVLANPFSRLPTDTPQGNLLDDPLSVAVCDLFNGTYELMIQLLMRFFAHGEESDPELVVLMDTAIGLMGGVLAPLAQVLTRMPAGPRHPGLNAGPSFQFFRSTQLLPYKQAAWFVFGERLRGLAARCDELSAENREGLSPIAQELRDLSSRLAEM